MTPLLTYLLTYLLPIPLTACMIAHYSRQNAGLARSPCWAVLWPVFVVGLVVAGVCAAVWAVAIGIPARAEEAMAGGAQDV